MFIGAARAGHQGAAMCNLRNDIVEVDDFVQMLQQAAPNAQTTYEHNKPLPFPWDLDDGGLRHILGGAAPWTPIQQAIASDLAHFRRLLVEGLIDLKQLAG
jgi:hypothetical protein